MALLGYCLGIFLSNKSVRNTIYELWCNLSDKKKMKRKSAIINFTNLLIGAIYEKNGNFSNIKFITIIVILNIFFFIGLYVSGSNNEFMAFHKEKHWTFFLSIAGVIIFGSIYVEYLSYRLTKFFYRKAYEKTSLKPIFVDLFLLIILFYILPLVGSVFATPAISVPAQFDLSSIPKYMLLIPWLLGNALFTSSPIFPFYIMLMEPNVTIRFLLAPAVLSVCLPTLLIIVSFAVIYNSGTLSFVVKLLEISEKSADRLKQVSLVLATFAAGVVTTIGYK